MRDICRDLQELTGLIGLTMEYIPAKEKDEFVGIQFYANDVMSGDRCSVEVCNPPEDVKSVYKYFQMFLNSPAANAHSDKDDIPPFVKKHSKEQMAEYVFKFLSGAYIAKKTAENQIEIIAHLPEFKTLSEFKLKWSIMTGD